MSIKSFLSNLFSRKPTVVEAVAYEEEPRTAGDLIDKQMAAENGPTTIGELISSQMQTGSGAEALRDKFDADVLESMQSAAGPYGESPVDGMEEACVEVEEVAAPITEQWTVEGALGDKGMQEVRKYMLSGQKVNAIKAVRYHTGLGLKEAKAWVDNEYSRDLGEPAHG